jgi:hypothetical protein
MLSRLCALSVIALLAAGCHSMDKPAPGSSIQTAPSQTRTAPVADDDKWTRPADYRAGGPVPPMESNRKINEQSCTQGVDLTAGNLMCR